MGAGVMAPVVASTAARPFCGVPPLTGGNEPHAYVVEPETARADTVPSTFGSQVVACPLVRSMAARWLRATPPADEKPPAANTLEPDTASAVTSRPNMLGLPLVTAPVVASSAARSGRGDVKLPPT